MTQRLPFLPPGPENNEFDIDAELVLHGLEDSGPVEGSGTNSYRYPASVLAFSFPQAPGGVAALQ